MKKFHLYCLLFLFLSSCASLIEKIEMNKPNLSCVKKEGENEYSVFGIKFKKKSEIISFVPSKSYCFKNYEISGFLGTFETNSIISHTKDNYKSGSSSFLQLTILNTQNVKEKYKTVQEFDKLVIGAVNKRVLEMKNNNNPRYNEFINKSGKISRSNIATCQDLFQSLHDSEAENLAKSEKYLVMNSFYKSCVIPKSEIFIDIALSVRANKNYIKNFDSEYLKKYIVNVEKSLVDKKSQQNLHSIIID